MNLQESSADLYLIFLAICNFKDHAVFALEYLLINLEFSSPPFLLGLVGRMTYLILTLNI